MQAALRLVYPARCITCGDPVADDAGICTACWPEVPFTSGTCCDACGTVLQGAATVDRELCDDCMTTQRPWRHGRAGVMYQGMARRLVLGLKHGDRHDVVAPAARWMARAGADILTPDSVLVPIPLHWLRLFQRRFNQSALLARAVADHVGCDVCPDALTRVRPTPSLDRRPAAERYEVLGGAIQVAPAYAARIKNAHVIVIDDVMTSGATFSAATEALLAAGAQAVDVLALARVGKAP
ncbi:MAG: ComF family protein [Pseudomonadota bacterium]